eukprot:8549277-Alexandrium_andersonii.AAC.1
MSASLVGSEMCIRDRGEGYNRNDCKPAIVSACDSQLHQQRPQTLRRRACLLYTSDAADDM